MNRYIGSTVNPVLFHNEHYLESSFGERNFRGKVEQHNGIDLLYKTKLTKAKADYIIAIDDGTVSEVNYSKSRGCYVTITHKNGFKSRYLHMKAGSIIVSVKQLIKKGQTIGYMGETGDATDVHLHLAILKNNKFVDPLPYLLGDKNFNGDNWETGVDYITLYEKFKRYAPCVGLNKVPYSVLSATDKTKCNNVGGYAKTKVGVKYKFYKYETDSKGNKWGCTTNPANKQKKSHWICVRDKNGDQVKRV